MGIDGLLNLLRPVTQKEHISSFKGQTIGVDAMPWIYKGCYSCAVELNQNIESIDFLYYIMEMVDMLGFYKIKPIFVFDGRTVHSKDHTLDKRKKTKEDNKQKGLEFLKNDQPEEARKYLSRCIIIDDRIITTTINALITKNVEFLFAPYEADCQLGKMKAMGIIDAVITEDSDLLVYGVNVLLKLNQNGECDYIDLKKWKPMDVDNKFLKAFLSFDELNRIDTAVLAGSDYGHSIHGIGIKKATKLILQQATISNVVNKLKFEKVYASKIPQNYESIAQKSKLIFALSTTYNTATKCLEYFNPDWKDLLKPEEMNEQELNAIVGPRYQFSEEMLFGKVNCKTLEKRNLHTLNFRSLFAINRENLIVHEQLRMQRKREEMEARKLNQQSLKDNHDDELFPGKASCKRNSTEEIDEEERERRKEERKNRGIRLKNMMEAIVDLFENNDDDDSSEAPTPNKNHPELEVSKTKEDIQDEASQGSGEDQPHEDSFQEQLAFLNPFARKKVPNPIIKLKGVSAQK